MFEIQLNKKGVVFFTVLITLLIVVTLAGVVVRTILNNARLTNHQISRAQAYYAGMAGINYASQMIRAGSWVVGTNCTSGCSIKTLFDSNDFKPPIFATSTNDIVVTINASQSTNSSAPCYNSPNGAACVSVSVNYTYSDTL